MNIDCCITDDVQISSNALDVTKHPKSPLGALNPRNYNCVDEWLGFNHNLDRKSCRIIVRHAPLHLIDHQELQLN